MAQRGRAYGSGAVALVEEVEQLHEPQKRLQRRGVRLDRVSRLEHYLDLLRCLLIRATRTYYYISLQNIHAVHSYSVRPYNITLLYVYDITYEYYASVSIM